MSGSEVPLRAAMVGLRHGHMGTLRPSAMAGLLGTFRQLPGVRIVALCEPDGEALRRELAHAPDLRGYESVAELVESEAFDLAVLALPASDAPVAAVDLLSHGKHCFLEKSVARTAAEFRPLVAAAQRSGAHVHVNYPWRHHPAVRRMRALLEDGTLGRPTSLAAQMITSQVGSLPGQRNPGGFAYRLDSEGGGMLHWLGAHLLEVFRFLLGDVQAVSAMCAPVVGNLDPGPTMDDVSSVSLRFASGAVGTFHTGYLSTVSGSARDFVHVWGTDGDVFWPALGPRLHASSRAPEWRESPSRTFELEVTPRSGVYGNTDWMFNVAEAFVRGIREGRPPAVGAVEGLRVLELTDAIYRASAERRWVEVAPPAAGT